MSSFRFVHIPNGFRESTKSESQSIAWSQQVCGPRAALSTARVAGVWCQVSQRGVPSSPLVLCPTPSLSCFVETCWPWRTSRHTLVILAPGCVYRWKRSCCRVTFARCSPMTAYCVRCISDLRFYAARRKKSSSFTICSLSIPWTILALPTFIPQRVGYASPNPLVQISYILSFPFAIA